MIGKFFEIYAIVKRIDKEDIQALKEFVVVLKSRGKSISKAVREVVDSGKLVLEELQD